MNRRSIGRWVCAVGLALVPAVRGEDAPPPTTLPLPVESDPAGGPVRVQWMGFAPDGRHLGVRASLPRNKKRVHDAAVWVFDVGTSKVVAAATVDGGGDQDTGPVAPSCTFSPKGDWLAYGDGGLRFLAVPPHTPALPGGGRIDLGRSVSIGWARLWADPTGAAVFVEDEYNGEKGHYRLQRVDLAPNPRGERVRVLLKHELPPYRDVNTVAMSPSGDRFAAVVDTDPTGRKPKPVIDCWTVGEKAARVPIGTQFLPTSLAFSPDGKVLAAGFEDGSVAWYDAASGTPLKALAPLGRFTLAAVAFHPTGKYLACGSFDQKGRPNLFVVDALAGNVLARVEADAAGVSAVCFSPDGKLLAAFGSSGVVKVWQTKALFAVGD